MLREKPGEGLKQSSRKTLPCGTVFSHHPLMNQMIGLDIQMDSA